MVALIKDRKTDRLNPEDSVLPLLFSYPVAAATKIFGGAMVALDANGRAVPASASAALKVVGRCEKLADNSAGAAGDINVEVGPGCYFFNNSAGADALAAANREQLVFAADDNTVALTDGGGTRPAAGVMKDIRTDGQIAVQLGAPSLYQINPELVLGTQNRVRAVVTAALAAYTYVAGVITENANGALPSMDGVALAVGDLLFLPAGIAAALADAGVYQVTSLGSAGSVFVLTRVDWMPHAAVLKGGMEFRVGGEGTTFKNTTWRAMLAADTFTVGTTDAKWFPLSVNLSPVLVAGTVTIATVPIFSSNSQIVIQRKVANTTAATVMYAPTNAGADGITPGNLGTASLVVQAVVAAGTINNADISTLHVTIINGQ